jgi:hypothetical protein
MEKPPRYYNSLYSYQILNPQFIYQFIFLYEDFLKDDDIFWLVLKLEIISYYRVIIYILKDFGFF